MERFVKGDIVKIRFPFSDSTKAKKRPALVLFKSEYDDYVLVPISSKSRNKEHFIEISDSDLTSGKLALVSYIRYNKLFTLNDKFIESLIGKLSLTYQSKVKQAIIELL